LNNAALCQAYSRVLVNAGQQQQQGVFIEKKKVHIFSAVRAPLAPSNNGSVRCSNHSNRLITYPKHLELRRTLKTIGH